MASPARHDDDDPVGGVRRRDDGLLLHNPDSLTAEFPGREPDAHYRFR